MEALYELLLFLRTFPRGQQRPPSVFAATATLLSSAGTLACNHISRDEILRPNAAPEISLKQVQGNTQGMEAATRVTRLDLAFSNANLRS